MGDSTQAHRQFAVSNVDGEEIFLVRQADIVEELGRPFQVEMEVLSEADAPVAAKDVIGQNMTLRIYLPLYDKTRYINGYVTRLVQMVPLKGRQRYRLTLSPWLWLLTRVSDCRIFQQQNVPDIVKKVCKDRGFDTISLALGGTYPTREYTVQYRETDFNFISRLLEEEGIYYYFEHENGKHKLVLADGQSSHEAFPDYANVPYHPPSERLLDEEFISDWVVEQEVQPSRFTLADYDYLKPNQSIYAQANQPRQHAMDGLEMYDWPGMTPTNEEAARVGKIRLEELQVRYQVCRGRSDARGLSAGYTFTLQNFDDDSQNVEHLVTSVSAQLRGDPYGSELEAADDEEPPYESVFTAMLSSEQFRPRRLTPKPVISGPQTAMVTGPSGDEIHTDEHGRVKVQFHWDRRGQADENSSCWIRVAQVWAGKKWGAMYIPRVGQEVIVEFLEGDPDRPIITGRVYNGDATPPYALPDNKTVSTLKSSSSTGGDGYNEIRFEDKAGSELFWLHAQKDLDARTEKILREWIGADRQNWVKGDQVEKVEGNHGFHVVKDQLEKIEGNHGSEVTGDELLKVGGKQGVSITGDRAVKIDGDDNLKSTNLNIKADQAASLDAGGALHIKVGAGAGLVATQDIHIKSDGKLILEAAMGVTIKCGGSFIVLDSQGLAAMGAPALKLNSGGSAGAGSGASPTAPAAPESPDAPADPSEPTGEVGNKSQAQASPQSSEAVAPGSATVESEQSQSESEESSSPQAQVLQDASDSGSPFCEQCEQAKKQEEKKKQEQEDALGEGADAGEEDEAAEDEGGSPESNYVDPD